jgi:hypothetical protein
MKDQTIETIAGMAGLTVLGVAALAIDGSLGETIMVAIAAGLGAFVRHVWPVSTSEASDNAAEVPK